MNLLDLDEWTAWRKATDAAQEQAAQLQQQLGETVLRLVDEVKKLHTQLDNQAVAIDWLRKTQKSRRK